jgi:hypothetical protein
MTSLLAIGGGYGRGMCPLLLKADALGIYSFASMDFLNHLFSSILAPD